MVGCLQVVGRSDVVHEADEVVEAVAVTEAPALDLAVVGGPLDLLRDHLPQAQVVHAFLEGDDLVVGLHGDRNTKLYIISSSEHLLLPMPCFFQQSVSLEKYSGGMRGRCGTTFLTIDRISLRSTKYLGGGAIVNDYRPNQNYHHQLEWGMAPSVHFQMREVGCSWMEGFAGLNMPIFDHNYKMLVNILFMPNGLSRAWFFFSTEGTKILLPVERFERYYRPKMQQFDPLAKSILETMASPKGSKSAVKNMLHSYRVMEYKRHPIGLLTLLSALNECKDIQIRDYSKHLVQFLIRSTDLSKFVCDPTQLSAVLAQFAIKRTQSFEKIKQTIVKYKMAELLMANHGSITPSHFYDIINLLTNNDRLTVTTVNRFVTLANIFQDKLLDFIKEYLYNHKGFTYDRILTQPFFSSLFYFFKDYPTRNDEQARLLYQFTYRVILSQNNRLKKMTTYSIHRNFPYSSRSPEGQYYKDIILQQIIERSKKNMDDGEAWNQGLLSYSILSFEFYKTMEVLQFRYEGELNYLKKQDLRVPQLPSFYWQKYELDPRVINKDHIARSIIKCVYPQRYKSTPELQTSTIKPPKITQNQIKIRTMSALELLGLKWKREVQVSGRYVDFLLDDIIIECDGDYHFDLYKMDYNESTQFRNLHLLLSGYKLLIFNIFEYNKHRSTQALADLINTKLQALRRHDAVMIL